MTGDAAPSAAALLFERVALIGAGLIGSSLARAMRERGLAGHIAVSARSQATLDTVERLALADSLHSDAGAAVAGADLVVIAAPVGAYPAIGEAIAARLAPGSIVTDVGSTKQSVIRDLAPLLPEGVTLLPGHPIAGTEHSGPEAGFGTLFEDRWCVLTPLPGTHQEAIDRVTALWEACGSMVTIMEAGDHDRVLAMTSHLPHILAYTIVGTANDLESSTKADVVQFSAGGFRDFTRIAASDPIMWRDVFLNNREAVLEVLQRFTEDLTALQRAIRWGEGDVLEALFRRTRSIRREVIEAHQAGTFDAREPEKSGVTAPDPDTADPPAE